MRTFLAAVPKVIQHDDFIAKQQASFLQETKQNMAPGVCLVIGDFSENYSFVVQDAAQSFHWNKLQATLHPFVCYYKVATGNEACSSENSSEIRHVSFVVISESNTHHTVAIHLFQKILIQFLIAKIGKPQKMIYFSDGCAAQYKNRKTLQTSVVMKLTLTYLLNGIFLLRHMENGHVMV